ncbi:hypothetical protein EIN_064830 [Entamoeba invadens IP1]|uniref:TLDc domain-containing protein n=1 Tax=Entamoeba invadens IP1 TaxID=370355 RepID=A0A0A1U029_ENTIV|nr:hypothetical protein EIN_064830 [Entamoeba invadens IP1]ELP84248.1 hypothetical protein EIN_064830 [Entamoeba invadens IP1]|eukprot:XP_004183594.1 hypothetical protein EIN_064830 [Entamoeba invadens IP1]
MSTHNVRDFEHWKNGELIYDSDKDPYTMQFIQKVLYGRHNVVVLIQTTDSNLFGVFHSFIPTQDEVKNGPKQYNETPNDDKMFLFSIKRHDESQFTFKIFNKMLKQTKSSLGLCATEKDGQYIYWIGNAIYLIGKIGEKKSQTNVYIHHYYEMTTNSDLIGYSEREKWFGVDRFCVIQL